MRKEAELCVNFYGAVLSPYEPPFPSQFTHTRCKTRHPGPSAYKLRSRLRGHRFSSKSMDKPSDLRGHATSACVVASSRRDACREVMYSYYAAAIHIV